MGPTLFIIYICQLSSAMLYTILIRERVCSVFPSCYWKTAGLPDVGVCTFPWNAFHWRSVHGRTGIGEGHVGGHPFRRRNEHSSSSMCCRTTANLLTRPYLGSLRYSSTPPYQFGFLPSLPVHIRSGWIPETSSGCLLSTDSSWKCAGVWSSTAGLTSLGRMSPVPWLFELE